LPVAQLPNNRIVTPESLDNAQELVEEFHRENGEIPGRADVE